jgi:hypothetical protein
VLLYYEDAQGPHISSPASISRAPITRFNTIGTFHLILHNFHVPRDKFSLAMWSDISAWDDAVQKSFYSESFTGVGLAETVELFRNLLSSWLPDVSSLSINTGNISNASSLGRASEPFQLAAF